MDIGQPPWIKQAHRHNPLQRLLSHGLFAVGALVAVVGVMVIGYDATLTPITLVVDGQGRSVYTNQHTVENVLREAGIRLQPEDLVSPNLSETLSPDRSTVIVEHARPVTVVADGSTRRFRSRATVLRELLKEANVNVGPHDLVLVDGQPVDHSSNTTQLQSPAALNLSPVTIVVKRAMPVMLDLGNGQVRDIQTATATVAQALEEAKVRLYLADRVTPDLSTPLSPNLHIKVDPSIPINIEVDGQTIRTRTHRTQIGDVLTDMGVTLFGQDYTQPPPDAPVEADAVVKVVRVREEFQIQQEPILFETLQVFDSNLELDTTTVKEGQNGVRQKRIRIRYENDQEVSRNVADEFVLQPPVDKVISYGTQVVVRTLDTPNGPIEYWRHFRVLATSYSASTAGTAKTSSHYGRTATGAIMQKGIVAVDPSVIALGTKLYVPNYGIGSALDTGGAIQGRRLDLGYDDDNLVLWYRWVDVYLLTPVPANIPYIIPNWPPEP